MASEGIPENAVVLFDGTDFSGWTGRDGGEVQWTVEDGAMVCAPRTGDITSKETFADHWLHLEFRCPDMPEATGQAKGNSGVFLQSRYEIQVLDSYGIDIPGTGDCGGVYNQFAPLVNACKPALEWQTYDLVFRAARVDDAGNVTENARITCLQNGRIILNNVLVEGPTAGSADQNLGESGPLRLQDHGNLVAFRNIWVVRLPAEGSDTYEPR